MPAPFPAVPFLVLAARLAAFFVVTDNHRILVEHRRLEPGVRAHVNTDLFAREPGHQVGTERQPADKAEHSGRNVKLQETLHQRRRIIEIEHERAGRTPGNRQPDKMRHPGFPDFIKRPRPLGELFARGAITLDDPFDPDIQIRPYRLRAEITAPHPAEHGRHEKQRNRGKNKNCRQVINFLGPYFNKKPIPPAPAHWGRGPSG